MHFDASILERERIMIEPMKTPREEETERVVRLVRFENELKLLCAQAQIDGVNPWLVLKGLHAQANAIVPELMSAPYPAMLVARDEPTLGEIAAFRTTAVTQCAKRQTNSESVPSPADTSLKRTFTVEPNLPFLRPSPTSVDLRQLAQSYREKFGDTLPPGIYRLESDGRVIKDDLPFGTVDNPGRS